MKYWLIFLLITILAFFQATFWPLNLVLVLVLVLGAWRKPFEGLLLAFLAGLILDLVGGRSLGFSSLTFVILVFLFNLYKSKFKATHPGFFWLFTLFSLWFYSRLARESFLVWPAIWTLLLLVVFWPLVKIFLGREENSQLRLL